MNNSQNFTRSAKLVLKIHDITLNFETKSQHILQNMGPKVRILQIHIKKNICWTDHELNILVIYEIYIMFPIPATLYFDILKTKLQNLEIIDWPQFLKAKVKSRFPLKRREKWNNKMSNYLGSTWKDAQNYSEKNSWKTTKAFPWDLGSSLTSSPILLSRISLTRLQIRRSLQNNFSRTSFDQTSLASPTSTLFKDCWVSYLALMSSS